MSTLHDRITALAERIETAMTDDGHRTPRTDETRYLAHVAAQTALADATTTQPEAPSVTIVAWGATPEQAERLFDAAVDTAHDHAAPGVTVDAVATLRPEACVPAPSGCGWCDDGRDVTHPNCDHTTAQPEADAVTPWRCDGCGATLTRDEVNDPGARQWLGAPGEEEPSAVRHVVCPPQPVEPAPRPRFEWAVVEGIRILMPVSEPDEREALAQVLYGHRQATGDFPDGHTEWADLPESWRDEWCEAADAVLAAGFRRSRPEATHTITITTEQRDQAVAQARAFVARAVDDLPFEETWLGACATYLRTIGVTVVGTPTQGGGGL